MTEARDCIRDSFDRFGDDLCGDLLRYGSISDCFAFECVSKMFKRSVFSAQKKLDINRWRFKSGRKFSAFNIECALEKCLFINELVVESNYKIFDQNVDLIRDNCSYLTSITLNCDLNHISPENWQLFGEKFGHSLRSITTDAWFKNTEMIEMLLKLTPNLNECHRFYLNDLIFKTNDCVPVLPQLKTVTAIYDENSDFESFADIYSDRLETIVLREHFEEFDVRYPRMSVMLSQLSRFQKLEVLGIRSTDSEFFDDIDAAFDSIAKNCQKLRELSFVSDSAIFGRIGHRFDSLKRLTLKGINDYDIIRLNVSDLSCCPNLTALKLIFRNGSLNGEHFADIHLHLPKLQCFELECYDGVDQDLLIYLASLIDLNYIKVKVYTASVTQTELRNFIKRSHSIRKIDFIGVKNISRQTFDRFIWRAKLSDKSIYELKIDALYGNQDYE